MDPIRQELSSEEASALNKLIGDHPMLCASFKGKERMLIYFLFARKLDVSRAAELAANWLVFAKKYDFDAPEVEKVKALLNTGSFEVDLKLRTTNGVLVSYIWPKAMIGVAGAPNPILDPEYKKAIMQLGWLTLANVYEQDLLLHGLGWFTLRIWMGCLLETFAHL